MSRRSSHSNPPRVHTWELTTEENATLDEIRDKLLDQWESGTSPGPMHLTEGEMSDLLWALVAKDRTRDERDRLHRLGLARLVKQNSSGTHAPFNRSKYQVRKDLQKRYGTSESTIKAGERELRKLEAEE